MSHITESKFAKFAQAAALTDEEIVYEEIIGPGTLGFPHQMKVTSQKSPSESKVQQVVSRGLTKDLAIGLSKTKFLRAVPFAGFAVGILFLAFSLLGMGPPDPWMIASAATGAFAVAFLAQLPFFKGKQRLEFEFSAITRLFKKNYNEIFVKKSINDHLTAGPKIYLGALPNRLRSDGEHLVNEEGVGAVLSVNESWERNPHGLSLPYSQNDWAGMRVTYKEITAQDHEELTNEELDQAADFIKENLKKEKNVYVHCRAGCGRSAMAVAAYLMRYHEWSAEEAANFIKEKRPVSTIKNKMTGLNSYQDHLHEEWFSVKENFEDLHTKYKQENKQID